MDYRCIGRLAFHNVVAVRDEPNTDCQGYHSDLPERNFFLGLGSVASAPSSVHTSPDTYGVANIIGTVGERGGTSGNDLHEGVQKLGLVRILRSV